MIAAPRISVVIPCHNLGRYLDEAVDSVLNQTEQGFEIIVVDDGSTDPDTLALLAAYHRRSTRVIRLDHNSGLPAARNAGIREAHGEYICCLDADDLLAPTYFERAIEVLDCEPTVSFVSHWLHAFGEENFAWQPERCDLVALLDSNTVNGAALVRRSTLCEVGLFDESMRDGCEDWDLWITLVERGYRGVILPEVLFSYRRRSDSMSARMKPVDAHLTLFRRLIANHSASYRDHLFDLLQRRVIAAGDLRRSILSHEEEYRSWWLPELERRREEIRHLQGRVDGIMSTTRAFEDRAHLGREVARIEGERACLEEARAQIEAALRAVQAQAEADRVRFGEEVARLEVERGWVEEACAQLEVNLHAAQAQAERDRIRFGEQMAALDVERVRVEQARARLETDLLAAQAQAERDRIRSEEQVARLEAERARLEEDLLMTRRHVTQVEQRVSDLLASLSWKVTAPLRAVYGWLLGATGRAR